MSRALPSLAALPRVAAAIGLWALAACTTPAPPPSPPPWIALSPLTEASAGAAPPAWLVRAATPLLRDELAAVPGLRVIVPPPPAPSAQLPGAAGSPPAGIQWLLGGTVAAGPDGGWRFELTLRRAADGAVAWQERQDHPTGTSWRRALARAVANQVGVPALPQDAPGLGACRDTAAGLATMQAIEAFGAYRSRDDLLRVRALLEQALAREPDCPEAMAHHAMTHVSELANRWSTDVPAQLALADRLSREAVAADAAQPYARMARVQVLRQQGRVPEALEEARTLVRLDPANGLFVGRLAALRFDAGDAAGTLQAALEVQRLPNGTLAALQQGLLYEGLARYALGEEAAAVERLQRVVALNPRNGLAWQLIAGIEAVQGHDAEAAQAFARYRAVASPGQTLRSLRSGEAPVADGPFMRQRERYYAALRRLGMPE